VAEDRETYPWAPSSGQGRPLMTRGVCGHRNDIEGFVPISQLSPPATVTARPTRLRDDESSTCAWAEVDPIHRRIVLSVTNIPDDSLRGRDARPGATRMKRRCRFRAVAHHRGRGHRRTSSGRAATGLNEAKDLPAGAGDPSSLRGTRIHGAGLAFDPSLRETEGVDERSGRRRCARDSARRTIRS